MSNPGVELQDAWSTSVRKSYQLSQFANQTSFIQGTGLLMGEVLVDQPDTGGGRVILQINLGPTRPV